MLRSGGPVGLQQEMWAPLAIYQVLRIAIAATPATDRASRQVAVHTAQALVTSVTTCTRAASPAPACASPR